MNLLKHKNEPVFFEDFINSFFGINDKSDIPPYNISDSEKDFLIEFSVPGFDKKDFNIELNDNILKVVKKPAEIGKNDNSFYMRQFNYSQFEKIFKISEDINFDKITSKYENGILKIILPKLLDLKRDKIKSIKIN